MQTLKGIASYEARMFSTLREMLAQSVELYGHQPAFCFRRHPKGAVLLRSYEEFQEDVKSLAQELHQVGSKRVAILGENSYEWACCFFAVLDDAQLAIPLDKQLPDQEALSLLARSEAEVFFFTPKRLELAVQAYQELPHLKHLICLNPQWIEKEAIQLPEDPAFSLYTDFLESGRHRLRLQSRKRQEEDVKLDPEQTALLLFTSGTTSQSKGVLLSQRNLCSNIRSIAKSIKLNPGEKLLSVLPMHHTFENTAGLCYPLYSGCTVCFTDGLRYLAKNLAEWSINAMVGVPLLYENIYKRVKQNVEKAGKTQVFDWMKPIGRGAKMISVKANRLLFSSVLRALGGEIRLMISGAAAIHPEVVQGFSDLGIEFMQGYGMTEHSPVITVCDRKHNSLGSVGHPLADVELAIDTEELYRGAVGEILVRSESVMQGYYGNEEATAEAIDEAGWLHTGDMGFFDNKDCLHITGRCKSMIVLENGKKIFPEECEEVFNQIEGVKESFVWGHKQKDKAEGKEVELACLLELDLPLLVQVLQKRHPQVAASLELMAQRQQIDESIKPMVKQYLEEQLSLASKTMPAYKKIKYFLYTLESLQRTSTMKIRREQQLARIQSYLAASNQSLRQQHGQEML